MIDVKDPKVTTDESQQVASETAVNASDSTINTTGNKKDFDDSAIYENMIFPS